MGDVTMQDRFGRTINYLRVSVTDRCNLRCVYCMPEEGVPWQPHADILTYEEITRVVELAAGLGLKRVRLTGGEPLVRKGIANLVESLVRIPEIEEISLTTNGTLLRYLAEELAAAGLMRVNVSLDTLQPEKFRRITRGGNLQNVLDGIAAAERAGLAPVKINVVVVRGVNDDELVDLARLTIDHPWQVRFIELMPVGNQQDWGQSFLSAEQRYFPIKEILQNLDCLGLVPAAAVKGNGPARSLQIPGAAGTLGFISPIGEHFCGGCNRLRLTADGRLRPCLLDDLEIPIREPLRAGEDLLPYFEQAIGLKPQGHALAAQHTPVSRKMAQIGG